MAKSSEFTLDYNQDQLVKINNNQRLELLNKWQKISRVQPNSQAVQKQIKLLEQQ